MTQHQHEVEVQQEQQHGSVPLTTPKDNAEPQRLDEEAAWKQVEPALKGTHVDHLPKFVGLASKAHKKVVADHLKDIAKVTSGDEVIEIGKLVDVPFQTAMAAAIHGTPEVTLNTLRRAIGAAQDPGMLDATTFKAVRARFGTTPLFEAIPGLVSMDLLFLISHEGFRKWFFETPKPIVAEIMSRNGKAELGSTLDEDPPARWAWIDAVRIGGASSQLADLAQASTNPGVKQRLKAKLGPAANLAKPERDAFYVEHAGDPAAAMSSGTSTRDQIFDAIARAGGLSTEADRTHLLKELKRLHAGADDILAATYNAGIVSSAALELVLAAPDVTPQHIIVFLSGGNDPLSLFDAKDQRLLREVRKRAPTLQLGVFGAYSKHRDVFIANEGLRRWFFESAAPTDLLEFCVGDPAHAPAAIRLVAARHPDWKWVHDLSGAEPEKQLRALALQCNHPKTEQYIRSNLLGDRKAFSDGKVLEGTTEVDPRSKQGEGDRLHDAIDHGTQRDVMERLIDLDARERLALGHDDASAKSVATSVKDVDFPRAAYLLDLSFRQTLLFCPVYSAAKIGTQVIAHLRSRPQAEELAALATADFAGAARHISPNLLVVFPSLTQPQQLAKSLRQTPALLSLLLHGSDTNVVMDLVSREPVLSVAMPILDGDPVLFERLPMLKHMSKGGQDAMKRLEKSAADTDSDIPIRIAEQDDLTHGTEEVAREGRKFHFADKLATLPEAIDQLARSKGTEVSALALLESHRAQVPALLADGALASHVQTLASLITLPPHVAIPYIAPQQLVEMSNSRTWFYSFPDATVLLHQLAKPQSRGHVAGNLTAGNHGAREWLSRLPSGRKLTDDEARTLDALRPFLHDADVLRELFLIRFGISAPAEYNLATVDTLYQAAARLPRSHVDQGVIKHITQEPLTDAAATWNGTDIDMDVDTKIGTPVSSHGRPTWFTREQLRAHYGYDDVAITAQLAAHRLETRMEKGVEQFRMQKQEQPTGKFANVVLHEIGHSVDDMLGNQTQPVFGWAKWRVYDAGEFDQWATEMGGWNRVREGDRSKIRQVWLDAMRSHTAVKDLVAPDHPALSKEYDHAGVKVVQMALHQEFPRYDKRVVVGDRVFTANSAYFGGFYSLQADAALSSPTDFSLYAPQEYFAECYAEYYREVDGTPGSRDKRGGGLPGPVKQWFDANVDTLKYDPHRFGEANPKKDSK